MIPLTTIGGELITRPLFPITGSRKYFLSSQPSRQWVRTTQDGVTLVFFINRLLQDLFKTNGGN